jgi:hypothetical protein
MMEETYYDKGEVRSGELISRVIMFIPSFMKIGHLV